MIHGFIFTLVCCNLALRGSKPHIEISLLPVSVYRPEPELMMEGTTGDCVLSTPRNNIG